MPGSLSGTFDPKVVESLIEVEKLPVESAKKRKEVIEKERAEFDILGNYLTLDLRYFFHEDPERTNKRSR